MSTIELVFNDKGYALAAKSDQFKNKPSDYAHPINMAISKDTIAQLGQYIALSKQISLLTSYGEDDQSKKKDFQAIQLICKVVLSISRSLPGFEKVFSKADIINANIPTIYNELIPNAQKAIFENLMKDANIENTVTEKARRNKLFLLLKNSGLTDDKIQAIKANPQTMRDLYMKYRQQITVTESDWFRDLDAKSELIAEATKRDMRIYFYFRYTPWLFEFGATNKAYVDPRTLKKLNDRLKEPVKTGEDLLHIFNNSESKIGAGLGLDLTKICIDDIANECGTPVKANYENDSNGMLIMNVAFDLGQGKSAPVSTT